MREQRIRNRLLMRELLLRLDAERVGAIGKSGLPTEYFEQRTRRMLLLHPRFALKYNRATKQARRQPTTDWRTRVIEAQLAKKQPASSPDLAD